MHRVFIYGTLKRGFPNHAGAMADFTCLGRVRTVERFPLVVGGRWFSPYLIAEPGRGHRVFGELFEADDRGLAQLDRLEGVGVPNGYRRISIDVSGTEGRPPFPAWTYVKDRNAIEAIHSPPMAEYALDPRYVVPAERDRVF